MIFNPPQRPSIGHLRRFSNHILQVVGIFAKSQELFLNVFFIYFCPVGACRETRWKSSVFSHFLSYFFYRVRCWLSEQKSRTFCNFFHIFYIPWIKLHGRGAARFRGKATVLRVGLGNCGGNIGTHPGDELGEHLRNGFRIPAAHGCALDDWHGLVCACVCDMESRQGAGEPLRCRARPCLYTVSR